MPAPRKSSERSIVTAGAGTVTAFEESAADGARVNGYEVPVTFG